MKKISFIILLAFVSIALVAKNPKSYYIDSSELVQNKIEKVGYTDKNGKVVAEYSLEGVLQKKTMFQWNVHSGVWTPVRKYEYNRDKKTNGLIMLMYTKWNDKKQKWEDDPQRSEIKGV